MVTMPKKVVPRQVDEFLRAGGGYTILPDYRKPEAVDRHLLKETHANWKIKCACGATLLLSTMDIEKVACEVDHWHGHEQHKKWIFHAQGIKLHYRGQLPAVQEESE
jgi:hypothetical protein